MATLALLSFIDPVGDLSLADLDTAVWIQSGQFPGSNCSFPDLPEMAFLQDHMVHKEESSSTISDMNDSAYMSQPDTSQKTTGGVSHPQSQDSRNSVYSALYTQSMFSPALNPVSPNPFQAHNSEIGSMALPHALDTDPANQAVEELTSAHLFHSSPAYDLQGPSMGMWPATDSQSFTRNFTTSPVDISFMYQQPLMRQTSVRNAYSSDEFAYRDGQLPHRSSIATNMPHGLDQSRVSTPTSVQEPTTSVLTTHNQSLYAGAAPSDSPVSSIPQQSFVAPQSYYNFQSSNESSDNYLRMFEQTDANEESFSASGDNSSTPMEESETTRLARTHPLYQATPQDDDLYHCPHEGEAGCTHKPTKLKCNYDKYVDSHLRPFRCKVSSCANTPFSSTACLLRHEREAHGMHGHGSKPHLCSFPDCERSVAGNGFPRRYNLFDHMKRVHDFAGSASPLDSENAQVPQPPANRKLSNRKRKPSEPDENPVKRLKTNPNDDAGALAVKKEKAAEEAEKLKLREIQIKKELFDQQRQSVLAALNSVEGPYDHAGYHAFMAVAQNLKALIQQQRTNMSLG